MLKRTQVFWAGLLVLLCGFSVSGYVGIPEGHAGVGAWCPQNAGSIGVEVTKAWLRQVGSACEDRSIQIPMVTVFPLDHLLAPRSSGISTDSDLAGHSPEIVVTAHVRRVRVTVIVSGTVTMSEDQEDWTTFRGHYEKVVSIAHLQEPGCRYHELDLSGELHTNGGSGNHEWTTYKGTDIIRAATCLSDTPGDDTGKLGCRILFRPIRLKALLLGAAP